MPRQIIERDAIPNDIGPEILAAGQHLAHLGEGVDDEVDGAADREVAQDLFLGGPPVVGDVGQLRMADDDQQVEVRQVAIVGLIDPVVAGIRAE